MILFPEQFNLWVFVEEGGCCSLSAEVAIAVSDGVCFVADDDDIIAVLL